MKEFFEDIFEYHHHFNAHIDQLSERTIPLFSHCLNAHQIWNARINNGEPFGVNDIHDPKGFNALDMANYKDTLQILSDRSLNGSINYSNSRGDQFSNTIQQILFHVANHFTHHKGQLISDLRAKGIKPLVTDYIFYKR